jgi:hypothetical protein
MDALAVINNGAIVCLDSTGYAVPGSASTTLLTVGIAQESKTAGSVDGDTQILVHIGVFKLLCDSAFSQANVGSICYVVDDDTVSMTGTGRSIAGTVAAIDGSSAWVAMGLEAAIDNTTLTAFEASLASTSTPGGASLVGIFDTAGYYAATTVEAALAEVKTTSQSVISVPIPAYSAIANSGVLLRLTPGYAGRILGMHVQATTAVTTGSKLATLTPAIAGTNVTGGVVSMTSAGQNAIGAVQNGTAVTALNTFTAAQEITVVASSVTAFVEGAGVIYLVLG